MKREFHFTNAERTRVVVTEHPGWIARLFGVKARTSTCTYSRLATCDWRFEIDRQDCPYDLADDIDNARRWDAVEAIPEARARYNQDTP